MPKERWKERKESIMDLKVIKQTENEIIGIVDKTSPALMNALRRAASFEVPVLAIEEVDFRQNSSALWDEMVALRLGLVLLSPLYSPSSPSTFLSASAMWNRSDIFNAKYSKSGSCQGSNCWLCSRSWIFCAVMSALRSYFNIKIIYTFFLNICCRFFSSLHCCSWCWS